MLVKMTNGTFGYREKTLEGYSSHVVCKSRIDPPFEVDEVVGTDLIARGVAVIVEDEADTAVSAASADAEASGDASTPPEDENAAAGDGDSGEAENEDDEGSVPQYSVDMTANELRAIMEANGLTAKPRMSKREMVDALDAYFGSDDEDGEQPPDLNAEAPIV